MIKMISFINLKILKILKYISLIKTLIILSNIINKIFFLEIKNNQCKAKLPENLKSIYYSPEKKV